MKKNLAKEIANKIKKLPKEEVCLGRIYEVLGEVIAGWTDDVAGFKQAVQYAEKLKGEKKTQALSTLAKTALDIHSQSMSIVYEYNTFLLTLLECVDTAYDVLRETDTHLKENKAFVDAVLSTPFTDLSK